MKKLSFLIYCLLIATASAQNLGPPGPGAIPNAQWGVSGSDLYYSSGGILLPLTVPGGDCGIGCINVESIEVNGAPLSALVFPLTVSGTTTSGGIAYFNDTTHLSSSALLTNGKLMQGGGAGAPPATFTLGGDCTFSTPNITCTKTSGVAFGPLATVAGPALTTHGVMLWEGSTITSTTGGTTGNVLTSNGSLADPTYQNLPVFPSGGRLTLVTHTPVMTAAESAKTTIFLDAYVSGYVPYYNGAATGNGVITASEMSLVLSSGKELGSQVFDVWYYNNAGSPLLCTATDGSGNGWSGDTGGTNTARGTGYTKVDNRTVPFITNANIITHCFNGATDNGAIPVNQATYLGTYQTDSGGAAVTWAPGAGATGGFEAQFNLWNYYNRVSYPTQVVDTGADYTYATAAWRLARNSASNTIHFVSGMAEDGIFATYASVQGPLVTGCNGCQGEAAISFDSTTAVIANSISYSVAQNFSGNADLGTYPGWLTISCTTTLAPQLGAHIIGAMEFGDGGSGQNYNIGTTNTLNATLRY